jgi:hypothetical protein
MPLIGSISGSDVDGDGSDLAISGTVVFGDVTTATGLPSIGTDTVFFVSGASLTADDDGGKVASFGGDVVVSGTLYVLGHHGDDPGWPEKVGITQNPCLHQSTFTLTDDDSAASNGRALHVVSNAFTIGTGYFSANNASSATSSAWVSDSGEADGGLDGVYVVYNADPASNLGGKPVYFDHDASPADRRLLANLSAVGLTFMNVQTSKGRFITVYHDMAAASNGVAVYHNSSGGATARWLHVNPSNSAGSVKTNPTMAAYHRVTGSSFPFND